jgi:hypothetical protein
MSMVAKQTERQAVQAKMQALKARMVHDYRNAKERVSQVADWKFYVSQYPWLSLGGVALASYAMVPAVAHNTPLSGRAIEAYQLPPSSSSHPTITSTLFAFVTRTASTVLMGAAARWATEFVNKRIAELTQEPSTQSCDLSRDGRAECHD